MLLYLWVLFALFALHRWILLDGESFLYSQGFAFVNALVLSKVLFFGQSLHLAENFRERPLIYPVLFKSAVFAALLMAFRLAEEAIKSVLRGKPMYASVAGMGRVSVEEIVALSVIVFVALIPLFAFHELARVIGAAEMRRLFLLRGTKLHPVSPAGGTAGDGEERDA